MVKTKISESWVENEDYELIPRDDNDWHVRIKKGEFIECVIRYGHVRFDEQNATVNFDFSLIETTDDRFTEEDARLKKVASHILHSIFINAFTEEDSK